MPTVTIEIPDLPDIEHEGVMYEFSGEVRCLKVSDVYYHENDRGVVRLWCAMHATASLDVYPIARVKKWVPEEGQSYRYIGTVADKLATRQAEWRGHANDLVRLKQNNVYKPGTGAAQADLERMLAARKGNEG